MEKQLLFTAVPLYAIGFLFNMVFSLTAIIIPLYGLSVGYSATEIGILLSVPGAFQIVLRMFTGIFSDRFGEKKMLVFTHCLIIISALIFYFHLGFLTLVVFQILLGTSRAIFWPTSQSYASRISSESSAILGRVHSFNEAGKISGIMFAGWAIVSIGYLTTFRLISVIGILGLLVNWGMKSIPLATGKRAPINNFVSSFINLAKIRPLQLALITSFFAGLLSALCQSFLPIWLKGLGNSEFLISGIVTAYMVGSLLAGRLYANVLGRLHFPLLLQLSLGGVGLGFLLITIVNGLASIFSLTIILGFLAGLVTVSYQVMGANHSHESNRGLIYSFVGLGWGIAYLTGPTLFGLLVDGLTITTAFACLGLIILLYAVFLNTIYSYFMSSYQKEQKALSSESQ